MPKRDGTGPDGKGAGTGAQRGIGKNVKPPRDGRGNGAGGGVGSKIPPAHRRKP